MPLPSNSFECPYCKRVVHFPAFKPYCKCTGEDVALVRRETKPLSQLLSDYKAPKNLDARTSSGGRF